MARRFPHRTASARRRVSWEEGPGGTPFTRSDTVPLLITAGVVTLVDGTTLVRTRGALTLMMKASAANSDSMAGAFGIGVTRTEAFSAGVGSVPTPIAEQDWDGWIYWTPFYFESLTDAEVINTGGVSGIRLEIDSKAMRKLDIGDVIYAAIEVGAEVGTSIITGHFDSRLLFKLP